MGIYRKKSWFKSIYAQAAIAASSIWLGWSAMRAQTDMLDSEARVRKARLADGWELNGEGLRAGSLWLGQGLGPCIVQALYTAPKGGARLETVLQLSVRAATRGTRIDSRLAADAELDKVAYLPRVKNGLSRSVRSGLPQEETQRKRAA